MLSKVLSGRQLDRATSAVFPPVAAPHTRPAPPSPDPPGTGNSDLSDQIRQLEARHSGEKRQAFDLGRQQAEAATRAEMQPVLERLNASITELTGLRQDLRRRAERDTVQLALLIARRILHRELAVDENALTAIARVAFERLTRSESYTVTVNPRFAPAITAAMPASQTSRVTINPDPACAPGALVFQSTEGVIDASIDSQLEEISRGLADRLQLV